MSFDSLEKSKTDASSRTRKDAAILARYGLERTNAGLISWRADSSDHPRNWSRQRKAFDITLIILLEFYTTVISTTGAAAANAAGPQYGLSKKGALVAFTLMYQVGQAIGGYLIPPFSELIGRRLPYLVSSIAFCLFCWMIPACPSVQNIPIGIYIGRFVTGFASAVPSVVIAGSVEDVFNTKRRVWIVILWNAGTTVGLCIGPIYASYIISSFGWQWVYYSAAAFTGLLSVALFWVKESRPSVLLRRKVRILQRDTGMTALECDNPDSAPDMGAMARIVLVRPMRLLLTEPLVIMVAIISGISWGIIYLFTESMTAIYQSIGFTKEQASLPFLAISVGVLFTFLPRFLDMRAVRRRHAKQEHVEPEDKIIGFAFATPALVLGLAWFAWTVPPFARSVPWIVPTLALVPIGFSVNEIAYTLSGYLGDSYLLYSASAFSGLAFVRALISGLMPLIAHMMYEAVDANIAGSILAGVSAVFCIAPWVFFRYSKTLRERSPFACHSLETHKRTQVEKD